MATYSKDSICPHASRLAVLALALGLQTGLLQPSLMGLAGEPSDDLKIPTPVDAKAAEFFESKVRPLLIENCYECHAGKKKQGGLKMDSREALLRGGLGGPAAVPGDPQASAMIEMIRYHGEIKMPPKGRLANHQIAILEKWVEIGLPWPGSTGDATTPTDKGAQQGLFTAEQKAHWAWQPMAKPSVPAVRDTAWPQGEIDRFILARLEAAGLRPAPPADKATLLRRVTFNLTGLPPTPEDADAFLADTRPDALARVVDRLLASPAYGERWGRHWLDVARYADSNGLDENTAFANAWRYRDWVVNALNADMPYSHFVVEQLAGDLLTPTGDPSVDYPRLTATGFLVLGPKVLAEPDKDKMVMDIVDEQIDTVTKAFMGVTMSCARCHDHKFDPLPTLDYYALAGIFKSTKTMAKLQTVARVLERPLANPEVAAAAEEHAESLRSTKVRLTNDREKALYALSDQLCRDTLKYLAAADEYLTPQTAGKMPSRSTSGLAGGKPMPLMAASGPTPQGTLEFDATAFTRGDVRISRDGFGQGIGIIESAGRKAAFAEYAFTLPEDSPPGEYQLEIRYAAAESRPIKITLDGQLLWANAAKHMTGGWGPAHQGWGVEGTICLKPGTHTLRIDQIGNALPHIHRLALVPLAGNPPTLQPQAPKSSPARSPSADRPATLAELAARDGLLEPVLKAWVEHVTKLTKTGNDPLLGPWLAFRALPGWVSSLSAPVTTPNPASSDAAKATAPGDVFAAKAAELVARWQADREATKKLGWSPALIKAFVENPAPKSQAEVMARYAALLHRLDKALAAVSQRDRKRKGQLIADNDLEALRVLLTDAKAPGSLPAKQPEDLLPDKTRQALEALKTQIATLEKSPPPKIEMVLAVQDMPIPENVRVHIRGSTLTLGAEAPRMFPRIIDGESASPLKTTGSGRLELAHWLTTPEHPLTARVMVNRVWQHHFGEGLVRTPDNFGKLGDRPSHPELLDWLARRFIADGWSLKALHRRIILSAAYQMSTAYNAEAALADPDNRLLWRAHRRRLEVEAIRDSVLAVAGRLDTTRGGSLLDVANFGYVTNDQSRDAARYDSTRRSLYLPVIRNSVFDVFQVFDFVEPSVLNGKRSITTVAPQALFLMNGRFVIENSRALAERVMQEVSPTSDRPQVGDQKSEGLTLASQLVPPRVQRAYRLVFGREASPEEVAAATAYLTAFAEKAAKIEPDATKQTLAAWQSLCQILMASSEFVFIN